jgi:signal transduction histidine kinase
MTGERWWHVFVAATIVVLAVINAFSYSPSQGQRIAAWVILGVIGLAYILVGRRSLQDGGPWVVFSVVIILGSGALVACSPTLAIVQAISFPLLWSIIEDTRIAVVANVLLALSVSAGFLVSLGLSPENIVNTAVIEGISLVGSLALGIWITRISHLSHERRDLIDELTATQAQVAALSRETGAAEERERLAREMHDTIAQSLTGLVMLSQRAQRELAAGNTDALPDQLAVMEETARDALLETRSLVASGASVEVGGGIVAAVERLGERFGRETGIRVSVDGDGLPELDRATEVVLLRCAQEALANVRKHSGARGASIALAAKGELVTMTVSDDGVGFAPDTPSPGYGLAGMRDRLALVEGTLTVASKPGAGTTLLIGLPA